MIHMARPRSMHKLAEVIWEMLDEEGFWDEADGRGARRSRPRRSRSATQRGLMRGARARRSRTKPKRKVSRYQKAFGACLKDLKRAHPRTPTSRLMKRAHACARKKKKAGGW